MKDPVTKQEPSAPYENLLKFLIIGDMCVGKSSLMLRYTENIFSNSYISTIGVDFKVKTILFNGKRVKLQIWDTAGQERFKTITASFYRGAHGIFVVYDVTRRSTFLNVTNWLDEIKKITQNQLAIVLIGNKCDEECKKQVSTYDGQKFADSQDIPFFETSALESLNVDKVFYELTTIALEIQADACAKNYSELIQFQPIPPIKKKFTKCQKCAS